MTQVTVTGLDMSPLTFILEHLRDADHREIEAVRGKLNPFKLALEISKLATLHEGWLFWAKDTGEPVACLGAYPMTPSCAGCWAFGTPDWERVVRTVTKHIHRIMIPDLLKAGFHRAECRALASREDTRRWLTGLGWKAEAVLSEFGTRREDFTLFAWVADEQSHILRHTDGEPQGELSLCDS
jgi:hypothetical protein